MKASSVRADPGVRRASADKAGKKGGQTSDRTHRQPSPLMSPALRAGWSGGGLEGMAGELASMPSIQRQSAVNSLQNIRGNSFVQRLAIQAKLKVGPARDRFEQQADHVADQVMRMTETLNPGQRKENGTATKPLASSITPLLQKITSFITPSLQRQGEEEEIQTKSLIQRQGEEEEIQTKPLVQRQGEEEEVQTKRATAVGGFDAGSAFESRLSATRGGGRPLPDNVRGQMEAGFGTDFSGVRVHTGSEAARLNRAVSAQAFTHGKDIYLGERNHDLGTNPDKRLLAHELTHVVQQTGAGSRRRQSNAAQAKPSGVLQRVLAFKPGDLEGELTFKAKAAGFFGKKSTWAQIQQTLKAYWADPKHPIALLMKLDNLADQWLARHGSSPKPNDQLKKQSLMKLKAKIQDEYASISGPKAPTAATTLPAGGVTKPAKPPVPTKPLPAAPPAGGVTKPAMHPVPTKPLPPTPTAKPSAPSAATTVAPPDPKQEAIDFSTAMTYWSDVANQMAANVMAMDLSKFKGILPPGFKNLDPIDYIAIKMYTMADYLYINPVLEESAGWLKDITTKGEFDNWQDFINANRSKIEKELSDDPTGAAMLGRMIPVVKVILMAIKKAFKKLGPYTGGALWRGEPRTEQAYKDTYNPPEPGKPLVPKTIVKKAFWSTTSKESVAKEFIRNNMGAGKLPVKLKISNPKGADVAAISNIPSEAEVLIPPVSEFEVVSAKPPHEYGSDGYQDVEVKQTKSGMSP